ncbi:MAG: KEOPS complex kinase/ATPase Bud32 [archaeon]
MELIREGAEAKLFLTEFEGRKAVLKKRINKTYRNKALNDSLIKKRTKQEYNLLNQANLFCVKVPNTYSLDSENGSFNMEYVEGVRLKDYLNNKNKVSLNNKKTDGLKSKNKDNLKTCSKAGKSIAVLHKNNIIHGDLTTSNFIVNKELILLDFGLGFRSHKIEDKATDLLNLKKTFLATHSGIKNGWPGITKAYCKNYESGKEVLEKLEEIEKRARYK